MKAAAIAGLESKFRPVLASLPPSLVVAIYSHGRRYFLEKLKDETPPQPYNPPEKFGRTLWGIHFRTSLMNAAGMFKNGECYEMVSQQGAGAYLGGTGTWNTRKGNEKDGIYLPFAPYPRSHSASNWLGLPNAGDETNSQRAASLARVNDCPVGWSVMGSPDLAGEEKLRQLVHGLTLYDGAGADFIEMNESCPNTSHGKPQDSDLANRLTYIKEHFLSRRARRLPVIVKFSNDTEVAQVPALMDLLFELGFDGVNFGNISTAYERIRTEINPADRRLFDYYTKTFGGGVSGRPLKEASLELAARAAEYVRLGPPPQEFHVIRTGGIETLADVAESERAGIRLNQWFTGYFENFAKHGHNVYRNFFNKK